MSSYNMIAKNNNRGRAPRRRRNRSAPRRDEERIATRPPVIRYTPAVFGFPERLLTKLRYAQALNIGNTVGALNFQSFRWNSIFDPDYTNAGHQPLYRDTYAAIYDHYAVVRARAKITFNNNNTATPYVVGVVTDDDSTPSSTYTTLIEQSTGMSASLNAVYGSTSSKTFVMTWDCAKVLNINPFTDETYKTAIGSNPTEESYLHCWAIPYDGSSTASIQVFCELEFQVLWTELATPTQS